MSLIWRGSPNFTPGNQTQAAYGRPRSVKKIIIHWIVGNLASADQAFQNPNRQASAHYGVEDGTIYQWVHEGDTAWHAGGPINAESIGIENSAAPGRPASDGTYNTLITLVAEICRRYGLDPRNCVEPHNKYAATQCPGTMDLNRIINGAYTLLQGNPQMEEKLITARRELNRTCYSNYLLRGLSVPEYQSRDGMEAIDIEGEIAKSTEAFRQYREVARRLGINLSDEQIKAMQNDFWHNSPGRLVFQFDIAPYKKQIEDLAKKLDDANLLTEAQKKKIESLTSADNIIVSRNAFQKLFDVIKNFFNKEA